MRVAILTYHWVANFGANLQTLSTYNYLMKKGLDPIVLNWMPNDTVKRYGGWTNPVQYEAHRLFVERELTVTRVFSDSSELPQIIQDYNIDGVIVGSDSLFNIQKPFFNFRTLSKHIPSTDHVFPNVFWGDGFYDIPHAGLSISCQNADYKRYKSQKSDIRRALEKFSYLTVRDNWTRELVSYFTESRIVPDITPDPVFMFNANVDKPITKEEILKKYGLPEKYALFCFNKGRMAPSEKWIATLKKLFNAEGITCVSLPKSTGGAPINLDVEIPIPLYPLDWYYLIKYSRAYIGVLMHPIVVSLHNAVPFFSFDDYGMRRINDKSSKIYHILEKAELLDFRFSLTNHIFYPDANKVFDKVMSFPTEKCIYFLKHQQEECLDNMSRIVSSISR